MLLGLLLVSRVLARNWAGNLAVERTCTLSSGPAGEEAREPALRLLLGLGAGPAH